MGYYAYANGEFVLKNQLMTQAELEEILDEKLGENPYGMEIRYNEYFYKANVIEFNHDDKYNDVWVKETLDAIAPLVVEGSCIEFKGEDYEFWAFTLKNGEWVEESGYVTYDDVDRLKAQLAKAIECIREMADSEEAFEATLRVVLGMNDEEVKVAMERR